MESFQALIRYNYWTCYCAIQQDSQYQRLVQAHFDREPKPLCLQIQSGLLNAEFALPMRTLISLSQLPESVTVLPR